MVLTLFFALVGTRVLYLYQNARSTTGRCSSSWQSGFVLYGGLIAGIAAGVLYIKMRGHSVAQIADLVAPSVMLALAFGRIGCFLNGCCHGDRGSASLHELPVRQPGRARAAQGAGASGPTRSIPPSSTRPPPRSPSSSSSPGSTEEAEGRRARSSC